jgi:hypothetical protein
MHPDGKMPPDTAGTDACRYRTPAGQSAPVTTARRKIFKLFLGKKFIRRRNKLFFERNGRWSIHHRSQTSGNPVKIRDGCATVTADKFPGPLFRGAEREGGKAV